MCGRFTCFTDPKVIEENYQIGRLPSFEASYNIAPTQGVLTVRLNDELSLEYAVARWGLIPSWMKAENISSKFINARCETLFEKPLFKRAAAKRRCLILASGFYEWHSKQQRKQPYFIHSTQHEIFAMAGIWERWQDGEAFVDSCCIITRPANDTLKSLHDRMPVVIDKTDQAVWLDNSVDHAAIQSLFNASREIFDYYPVNPAVNNPRHNLAQCIAKQSE